MNTAKTCRKSGTGNGAMLSECTKPRPGLQGTCVPQPYERDLALKTENRITSLRGERDGTPILSLIDVSVGGTMTKEVKTIEGSRLLEQGVRLMRDAHIGSVVVVDGYRP